MKIYVTIIFHGQASPNNWMAELRIQSKINSTQLSEESNHVTLFHTSGFVPMKTWVMKTHFTKNYAVWMSFANCLDKPSAQNHINIIMSKPLFLICCLKLKKAHPYPWTNQQTHQFQQNANRHTKPTNTKMKTSQS